MRKRLALAFVLAFVAACDRCSGGSPGAPDAPAVSAASPSASVAPPASTPQITASSSPSDAAPPPLALGDGGAPCPLVFGPKQLPFTGAATITANGNGIDVVFFAGGRHEILHEDTPKAPAAAPHETTVANAAPATTPGCAASGPVAFCMDRDGTVSRHFLGGGLDGVVGKAKPGTRLAAATAGNETVVGFLAERKTSEGVTTEAWIVGQATPLTRISDDGAGATFVALAAAGPDKLVALYIDGRRGMAPIHGVNLSLRGGKVVKDKDEVLFVAGGAETYTGGALATWADGRAAALVPIAHDVGFGLLVTRFGVPGDEHWSDYDNGLDPAPIAATALGAGDPWAARVKPSAAKFGAPRVLELGRVTAAGFVPRGILPTHGSPTDVALAADPGGALTVVFTDASGTWFERLGCGS